MGIKIVNRGRELCYLSLADFIPNTKINISVFRIQQKSILNGYLSQHKKTFHADFSGAPSQIIDKVRREIGNLFTLFLLFG